MRTLRYLIACAVGGVVVGRAFGGFARASFHYPPSIARASYWHQSLLNALDVIEWPGLFCLTLAIALGLWRWIGPRVSHSSRLPRRVAMLGGIFGLVAAAVVVPYTNSPGDAIAGATAFLMGLLAAALVLLLWREASAPTASLRTRWLAQFPIVTGHFTVTTTAALSLGFTGESALVHGIALLTGVAIWVGELALAAIIAAVAGPLSRATAIRDQPPPPTTR